MGPFIKIGNLVSFSPWVGVLVHREALDYPPEQLLAAIRLAHVHIEDEVLIDACSNGGRGPLAGHYELSYEDYLRLIEEDRISEAGKVAKRDHTGLRRLHFNSHRSRLVLAMIEAGIPYVCAVTTCAITDDLTVDHIIPISRGGTDDLGNLRFLCKSHNSSKGDRL